MSRIYNHLEPKHNKSSYVLDGCHWFNADNGVFGTRNSAGVIDGYLHIFHSLRDNNIMVEKFNISDKIYHRLHNNQEIFHKGVEKKLQDLDFKHILVTFPEDKKLIEKRIQDRLSLYPHYKNIVKSPEWYMGQQNEYKKEVKKSKLPYLIVNTRELPDDSLPLDILKWIGEKK